MMEFLFLFSFGYFENNNMLCGVSLAEFLMSIRRHESLSFWKGCQWFKWLDRSECHYEKYTVLFATLKS